jgi:hypothetical protein
LLTAACRSLLFSLTNLAGKAMIGPVVNPATQGERSMRWTDMAAGVLVAGVLAAPLQAGEGKARTFRFAKGEVGKVPDGWTATQTNKGANSSLWKVVADDTAPSKSGFALAQTAESPAAVFNTRAAASSGATRTPTITTLPA